MTRETMIDEVIKKWGFENEITITFCKIAEELESDYAVENMFIVVMALAESKKESEEE